jgi:hypothetical protein
MARRAVDRVVVTQRAIDKGSHHGITSSQMQAVAGNDHILARNRKGRAASHLLIGRDDQGRCLAIPVVPTEHSRTWRAITAWFCKPSEAAKLR